VRPFLTSPTIPIVVIVPAKAKEIASSNYFWAIVAASAKVVLLMSRNVLDPLKVQLHMSRRTNHSQA
jgi:hypothetical protein